MNKIKFTVPFSLIILLFCSFLSCTSSNDRSDRGWMYRDSAGHDFRFTMKTDKPEYEFGENVFITYRLVNTGIKTDTIAKTFFNSNYLSRHMDCLNEKGDTLKWSGYDATYSKLDYVILKPGEEITTTDNLNFSLGNERLFIGGSYFKSGNYNMVCRYKFISPSQYSVKNILSNIATFKINSLSDIDAQIYKELDDYENRIIYGPHGIEIMKGNVDTVRTLIRKYPKSIFILPMFDEYSLNREWFDYKYDETLLEDIEFLIENNPESVHNKSLIYTCINLYEKKFGGKEKAKEYLSYLKDKFNNVTLSKYIDEVSENINWK